MTRSPADPPPAPRRPVGRRAWWLSMERQVVAGARATHVFLPGQASHVRELGLTGPLIVAPNRGVDPARSTLGRWVRRVRAFLGGHLSGDAKNRAPTAARWLVYPHAGRPSATASPEAAAGGVPILTTLYLLAPRSLGTS